MKLLSSLKSIMRCLFSSPRLRNQQPQNFKRYQMCNISLILTSHYQDQATVSLCKLVRKMERVKMIEELQFVLRILLPLFCCYL